MTGIVCIFIVLLFSIIIDFTKTKSLELILLTIITTAGLIGAVYFLEQKMYSIMWSLIIASLARTLVLLLVYREKQK